MMPGSSPGMTKEGHRGSVANLSGQHAHDVGLLHDQELFAIELDLGARPFAEQHAVADLEVDRNQLAGLVAAARTNCRDLALRGLLFGGVGDDDAALGLLFGIDTLDHHTVVQRTELGFGHEVSLFGGSLFGSVSRKRIGMRPSEAPGSGAKKGQHLWQSYLRSANRAPEIWPGAGPVKQSRLKPS